MADTGLEQLHDSLKKKSMKQQIKDKKPNKWLKDPLKSYKGKWCMMFFQKNGACHKYVAPLVYDTEMIAQSEIDRIFRGQYDLSSNGNTIVKFKDLSYAIPMPTNKK